MNSIGERIAYFRKSKGMTQEALAKTFGISTQAVSKWETGTTMPDILLLPVIADLFDTSIDSLFGVKQKDKAITLTRENIHEEMHGQFFLKMQELWVGFNGNYDDNTEENAKEAREYIKEHKDNQTLVLSNFEGNGVYADADIAITFNKDKNEITELFDNDEAWTVLKRFADGETRSVFKFILHNSEKAFTSSLIAAKINIEIKTVERALDNLLCMKLIKRDDVDTGDGIIYVYRLWAPHKKVLVYSMLSIAARIGTYKENYCGFIG